jgi:phage replication O-like protein O
MARGEGSPQLANGYTSIANEILEELAKINLSGYETRVLVFIIRKTYGWHKKADRIPHSQIVKGTGIHKAHVSKTVKRLADRNLITRDKHRRIGFQKDYKRWGKKLPNRATFISDFEEKVAYSGNKGYQNRQQKLPNSATSKETIQKKLYKRKASSLLLSSLEEEIKNIKASDWYTAFKRDYPSFKDTDLEAAAEWIEEHNLAHPQKPRLISYRFLINWARKMSPKAEAHITEDDLGYFKGGSVIISKPLEEKGSNER